MNSVIALFHVNLSVSLTGARSPKYTIKWFLQSCWEIGLFGGGRAQINYVLVFVSSNTTDEMLMGYVLISCFLCKA